MDADFERVWFEAESIAFNRNSLLLYAVIIIEKLRWLEFIASELAVLYCSSNDQSLLVSIDGTKYPDLRDELKQGS